MKLFKIVQILTIAITLVNYVTSMENKNTDEDGYKFEEGVISISAIYGKELPKTEYGGADPYIMWVDTHGRDGKKNHRTSKFNNIGNEEVIWGTKDNKKLGDLGKIRNFNYKLDHLVFLLMEKNNGPGSNKHKKEFIKVYGDLIKSFLDDGKNTGLLKDIVAKKAKKTYDAVYGDKKDNSDNIVGMVIIPATHIREACKHGEKSPVGQYAAVKNLNVDSEEFGYYLKKENYDEKKNYNDDSRGHFILFPGYVTKYSDNEGKNSTLRFDMNVAAYTQQAEQGMSMMLPNGWITIAAGWDDLIKKYKKNDHDKIDLDIALAEFIPQNNSTKYKMQKIQGYGTHGSPINDIRDFYKNAVIPSGDDRSGVGGGDDEFILLNLDKLERSSYYVVSLFAWTNHNLKTDVKDGFVRVANYPGNPNQKQDFSQLGNKTTIVYERIGVGSEWKSRSKYEERIRGWVSGLIHFEKEYNRWYFTPIKEPLYGGTQCYKSTGVEEIIQGQIEKFNEKKINEWNERYQWMLYQQQYVLPYQQSGYYTNAYKLSGMNTEQKKQGYCYVMDNTERYSVPMIYYSNQ